MFLDHGDMTCNHRMFCNLKYYVVLLYIALNCCEYSHEHGGEWVLQCCSHGTVQRSSAEAGPGRSSAPPCLPYRCTNHAISSTLHPPPAPQTLNFNICKIKPLIISICFCFCFIKDNLIFKQHFEFVLLYCQIPNQRQYE